MVLRYDTGTLNKAETLGNGMLRAPASLTRTGVFVYHRADGSIVRELRHPDEVFSEDSMSTLSLVALTMGHPSDPVTADNFKALSVGTVGENITVADSRYLDAQLMVSDAKAIKTVESGRTQVSCGYFADVVEESGEFEGERYDAVQKNIRYNHVAFVDRGRAGPNVKIHLDEAGDAVFEETRADRSGQHKNEPKGPNVKFTIDGVSCEVSENAKQLFERHIERLKEDHKGEVEKISTELEGATAKADDLSKKCETESARADSEKDRADKVEKEFEEFKGDGLAARIQERVALEKTAAAFLSDEEDLSALSVREIQAKVVEKDSPDAKLDERSDEYVSARFDHVVEQAAKKAGDETGEGVKNARKNLNKADGSASSAEAARARMLEKGRNAWKAKGNK